MTPPMGQPAEAGMSAGVILGADVDVDVDVEASPFSSLTRVSLWTTAVEQIRDLIETGRLVPGQRLPGERELCQQLGISRVSLREAIRVLESAGYLDVRPGRGTFVLVPPAAPGTDPIASWLRDHDDILHHLFELRLLVEPGIAALAAQRRTPEMVAALREQADLLAAAAAAGDQEGSNAADAAFHRMLAAATGNPVVGQLVPGMMQVIGEERRASLAIPGQLERAAAGHRAILAAVEAGDAGAAERAMRQHLRDAIHYIERWIAGERP